MVNILQKYMFIQPFLCYDCINTLQCAFNPTLITTYSFTDYRYTGARVLNFSDEIIPTTAFA